MHEKMYHGADHSYFSICYSLAKSKLSFSLRHLYWHFDYEKTKATSDSIACEETPALNLQIIFRKLACSAMQCLLMSKLSNEKVNECHATWKQ